MYLNPSPLTLQPYYDLFTSIFFFNPHAFIIIHPTLHFHKTHPIAVQIHPNFSHHTSSLQPPFTLVVNHILSHCIIHPHASLTNKQISHNTQTHLCRGHPSISSIPICIFSFPPTNLVVIPHAFPSLIIPSCHSHALPSILSL